MNWEIIKIVVAVVVALLTSGVPTWLALRKAFQARRNSNDAERVKADAELLEVAKNFIASAEATYNGLDKLMKPNGDSAGGVKKETVYIRLHDYALQRGYVFDETEWREKIDNLVSFTKEVNAKK